MSVPFWIACGLPKTCFSPLLKTFHWHPTYMLWNKNFLTILQQPSANIFLNNFMKNLDIFREFGEQLENFKFWLYTVNLGDVCYEE